MSKHEKKKGKDKSEKSAKAAKPEKAAAAPAGPVKAAKPEKAKPKKPAGKAKAPAVVGFSVEDICLRAYFIAEKRQSLGHPGDEMGDWVEAERQLRAESGSA